MLSTSYYTPCTPAWRNSTGQALRRLDEFRLLTSVVKRSVNGKNVRAVLSAGGAAGDVVSEGQGYGLLIAGTVMSTIEPSHPRWTDVVTFGYELFLGWQRMCERTTINDANRCLPRSNTTQCGPKGSECFPSWKFNDRIDVELGVGSAPDGDEDALLGMVLYVLATDVQDRRPIWWDEVASWAYDSCRAFLPIQSVEHPVLKLSSGMPLRALKLGSCWGGWDCTNPSCALPQTPHHSAASPILLSEMSSCLW